MRKLITKFKRWYMEGLTGELSPDWDAINKQRRKDLKRLEKSIRLAKEKRHVG